jgi:hypothetical protein
MAQELPRAMFARKHARRMGEMIITVDDECGGPRITRRVDGSPPPWFVQALDKLIFAASRLRGVSPEHGARMEFNIKGANVRAVVSQDV